MLSTKVLIIGAGAAGIAAASCLVENKINDFIILEAQERIGGRIFTSQLDGGVVELGAQWIHGQVDNIVYSLGNRANLVTEDSTDLYQSQTVFSDGSFMDEDNNYSMFLLCKELLGDVFSLSNFNGSLGEYINYSIWEKIKQDNLVVDEQLLKSYLEWFHKFQNSIDGSDSWFQTSARGTLEYHECPGYSLIRWLKGGYASIFDILMGKYKKTIQEKIKFNKAVKRINWEQLPVQVFCSDGEVFYADHVLVTASLGFLKENISTLFTPPLPDQKRRAIETLGFGTVAKIFLKFPYRWWPADCTGFNLVWKEPQSSVGGSWESEMFGFYSVDNQPSVLTGWIVGLPARAMEQSSDTQVLEACHRMLLRFLGTQYVIPAPESVLRSQWYSNPYVRGSYSFRTVDSDEFGVSAADLAAPLLLQSGHPAVLFGGEATHDHFFSTVHGAVESGLREADRIIRRKHGLLKSSL